MHPSLMEQLSLFFGNSPTLHTPASPHSIPSAASHGWLCAQLLPIIGRLAVPVGLFPRFHQLSDPLSASQQTTDFPGQGRPLHLGYWSTRDEEMGLLGTACYTWGMLKTSSGAAGHQDTQPGMSARSHGVALGYETQRGEPGWASHGSEAPALPLGSSWFPPQGGILDSLPRSAGDKVSDSISLCPNPRRRHVSSPKELWQVHHRVP